MSKYTIVLRVLIFIGLVTFLGIACYAFLLIYSQSGIGRSCLPILNEKVGVSAFPPRRAAPFILSLFSLSAIFWLLWNCYCFLPFVNITKLYKKAYKLAIAFIMAFISISSAFGVYTVYSTSSWGWNGAWKIATIWYAVVPVFVATSVLGTGIAFCSPARVEYVFGRISSSVRHILRLS